jgi:hypothetical protein
LLGVATDTLSKSEGCAQEGTELLSPIFEICSRDVEHDPPGRLELILATPVTRKDARSRMPAVAVEFDAYSLLEPRKVESTDEAAVRSDGILQGGFGQTGEPERQQQSVLEHALRHGRHARALEALTHLPGTAAATGGGTAQGAGQCFQFLRPDGSRRDEVGYEGVECRGPDQWSEIDDCAPGRSHGHTLAASDVGVRERSTAVHPR